MRLRLMVLTVLTLALVTVLGGCRLRDRTYGRVTPHAEAYVQTDPAELERASDDRELYDLLVRLIDSGVTSAVVDVSQYGENWQQDVEQVVADVRRSDPLAAYAVNGLQISTAEVGVRSMATVTISYSKTTTQLRAIQSAWGYEGIRSKVESALKNAEPSLTLRVTAYQFLDLNAIVQTYYRENLDQVMECPRVTVHTYPNHGTNRIMDIRFHYSTDQQTLQQMAREVQVMLSSASGYIRGQETELEKAERLSFFLQPLVSQEGSTTTPVYSVLYQGLGDSSAVATVFDLLCREVNLECQVVKGTWNGQEHCWNILRLDGVYYHLDLPCSWMQGAFRLTFDDEMSAYDWDTGIYPQCQRPQEPDPTENPDPPPEGGTTGDPDPTNPTEPEPTEPGDATGPAEPDPTVPDEPTEPPEPTEPEQTNPQEP